MNEHRSIESHELALPVLDPGVDDARDCRVTGSPLVRQPADEVDGGPRAQIAGAILGAEIEALGCRSHDTAGDIDQEMLPTTRHVQGHVVHRMARSGYFQ